MPELPDPGAADGLLAARARAASSVIPELARWVERLDAIVDPRTAARDLLGLFVKETGSTRGSILHANPRTGRLRVLSSMGAARVTVGQELAPQPRRISDWVMRERRSVILNGQLRDSRFDASAAADHIVSAMSLPLCGEHGTVGVLNLARCEPGAPFTAAELARVESLTGMLTLVLQRIEELGSARLLWQQALQRRKHEAWPSVRGGECAHACIAGRTPGADLCERFVRVGGTLVVMLAHPFGDPARAVRLGEWLRGYFCAAAPRLEALDRFALELHERQQEAHPGSFARVWLGSLTPTGELRSCSAGYPVPFHVPADGEIGARLDKEGAPLGATSGVPAYAESAHRLLPGDAVVVVNDCVLQATSPSGEPFGVAGVLEWLLDRRRSSLEALVHGLVDSARAHAAGLAPAEDLVALALRHRREPA